MSNRGMRQSKVMAIGLILCLIFTHCFTLFSSVSFADTNELGKQSEGSHSNNVDYDVTLVKNNEEKGYEYEAGIDEKDLALHIRTEIKNQGYLKNAKVSIESDNGLSFDIENSNNGYRLDGNQLELSNISVGEKVDLLLPIKYKSREDIENLNKKISVKLVGTYVDNSGDEKGIYENVVLRLIWNMNTEFNLSSKLEKYIPYDNGVIVQTSVKSEIPVNNSFVAKEEINIDAIGIDGYNLDKVSVLRKSGENLPDNSWNYDKDNNKINIKIENQSEKIKSDEFLITYVFSGKGRTEIPFRKNSKINGTIFMFGTNETATAEIDSQYVMGEKLGEIVSIEANAIVKTMKIGNLIANSMNDEKVYKTNYDTKIVSNISSKDMVDNIVIKDISEEFENEQGRFETQTSYYKSLEISKDNFEKILGQDGEVQIFNTDGQLINTIDKNAYLNEKNNYLVNMENNINKVIIKTSKPVSEGNFVINISKEMVDTEYSIDQLKLFSNINLKYCGSVVYSGNVESKVSDMETEIKLEKPITKADISISRDSLSTIADNNEVEMTVKLNNTNENIDLYKNPSFEIIFPEQIEDIDITNIAIANSENVFDIADAQIYTNNQGRIILDIKLEGDQVRYNTNNLSNGTNIIIKANIKLDIYAQSRQEKIMMTYSNENATSYETVENGYGYTETKVEYKAPTGMVSVNKISNYAGDGSVVASVEQGKITDKIEIFDEAKIATMDILVMNNNENNCNDIKILGRIPFKGNKDVKTGEDLGTTLDTKLVSGIVENNQNLASATIYYSTNGEATEELENPSNKWTTNITDLSKVRSYLIVPNNYEMKSGDVLRYSYQYEIPANLEHNNDIYGSFEAIYNNVKDVAITKEVSSPDIVGLTTGTGPQLSVNVSSNVKDTIKEYEKIKYTVEVKNTGNETAENVEVRTKLPNGGTFAVYLAQSTVEASKGWNLIDDKEISTTIDEIKAGEVKKIEFFVQANKLPSIEEYYSNTEGFAKNEDGSYSIHESYTDENGEVKYKETKIDGIPQVKLVCESIITAKDLAKEIQVKSGETVVEKSKIVAEETIHSEESIAKVNENIEASIQVKNNSSEIMKNIKITKVVPAGLNYAESYVRGYEDDGITIKKINSSNYNTDTRTITWEIESLEPGRTAIAIGNLVVGEMKENTYKETISSISKVQVNGEEYQAGQVDIEVGRPYLVIEQTSNRENEYVKSGDEIEYMFNVKNVGAVRANDVTLTDILPDEVQIRKLTYNVDGVDVSKVVSKNEDATVYTSILPENKLEVRVTARVGDISQPQKTIKNIGHVSSSNTDEAKSNEVTNIIERTVSSNIPNDNKPENNNNNNSNNSGNSTDGEIKTKYEIKGTAWLDKNKNGARDNGEDKLSGIEVKLINAINNEKVAQTVTSIDGEYEFTNLENGAYIVIFYYDNARYALTDYKKQNVDENKNSDVISVAEDNRNIASTETIAINNGSKSNIDIGLIEATLFDLSLEKSVTKVTVQTNSGTKAYNFNYANLAKVDINAKYLNGAKVIVEYTFKVKNEGEIEGYAKNIVDYMPKDLEFSTELNSNWYKGNDGNLYTEQLANKAIAAGETKEIKLVLTKAMTETNTGITNNEAEIAESYNKAGIKEYDSIARNKNPKEDDMSSADLIIGVKTGDTLIYLSVIISIIIIAIVAAVAIKKSKIILKIQLKMEKEV